MSRININTGNIQSTADLTAMRFDTAVEVPISYVEPVQSQVVETSAYKGIYNETQGHLAMVAGDTYQIIQHGDVVQAVANVLQRRGIEVTGRVRNSGDVIRADLVFGEMGAKVKDPDSGMLIGIRVVNSYNRQTAFRCEMFGYRLICSNGMVLGTAMNGIKEVTFHVGKEKNLAELEVTVTKFIDNVINSCDTLQGYVDECLADSTEWSTVGKMLEKMLKAAKHRKAICERLGIDVIEVEDKATKTTKYVYLPRDQSMTSLSRWTIYNAVTNYATHVEHSFGVEDTLQNAAQKLLVTPLLELAPVEVPQ